MRKIAVLLASVAALLALGAGAVFAQGAPADDSVENAVVTEDRAGNQTIQCRGIPCIATGSKDLVFERRGTGKNDRILLKGGSDQVRANTFARDQDIIKGSAGFDLIYVNDGDTRDRIFGGRGNDKCYVDARSEIRSGCSVVIVR